MRSIPGEGFMRIYQLAYPLTPTLSQWERERFTGALLRPAVIEARESHFQGSGISRAWVENADGHPLLAEAETLSAMRPPSLNVLEHAPHPA